MTQHADIPATEIEDLLRLLAGRSDHAPSGGTTTTLRILAMTEWSARIVSISVATLTGIAITLTLATGGKTTARANPAVADSNVSRLAKTNPLFSRHDAVARGRTTIATLPAITDGTMSGSPFAFIRGGLDDAMLRWKPAERPTTIAPAVRARHRIRRARKAAPKPVHTATTEVRHQPWLIDVIIRHIARGS